MAVARWNPWNDLFDLHNQVDQLFSSLAEPSRSNGVGGDVVNLPVDIRQTDDEFVIEASVPGFAPEQVEVTFDDGVLTIKGQRSQENERKDGQYVRRERRQASVYRQIGLPAEVRADEISAAFDNGVLHVTVPRAQKAQPKRIPVTAGERQTSEPKVLEHHSS
ncbi:MAG: Hsp20/alpha crystallin family protein [Candidatus Dormibacteraeota bacterium]|nr:Hsp20/alpha crystallin family protein [Candidatus Dormibacteraeota bacterium]